MSKFRLIERGNRNTMLLVSGWATDHRIFDSLDIKYNYLIPTDFSPFKLADDLPAALKENKIARVSMLGFSMGAFVIWDMLSRYEDMIDEVYLVSARRSYSRANNETIKTILERNRRGFLRKFYGDCFSESGKGSFEIFKRDLMRDYVEGMDLKRLFEGLDYLSEHPILPRQFNSLKVKFVHGTEDKIAPIEEVRELVSQMPGVKFITVEGAGHIPFLSPAFGRALV